MPNLLEAFQSGDVSYSWSTIESGCGEHFGRFRVFTDAARVNGVRPACSPREAQQCADLLGAVLPTPRLLDLRHRQATVKIDPHTQTGCPTDAEAVKLHSRLIAQDIDRGGHGMVSPVGKQWVLYEDKQPALYGWHVPHAVWAPSLHRMAWRRIPVSPSVTDPAEYVIQRPSTGNHNLEHCDYSSLLLLVHGTCEVDGCRRPTASVYCDPELCGLVVASGRPLRAARYLAVPETPMGTAGAVGDATDAVRIAIETVGGALEDMADD